MRLILVLALSLFLPPAASAVTYYLSPTGSNSNNGTSASTPWLTFSFAIGSSAGKSGCSDELVLLSGVYGDGTSTGKPLISGLVCTAGNEFTLRAEHDRQAKIVDNGTGYALRVQNSAYIVLDGLYVRSTDNNYLPTSTNELGEVFYIETSHHITARNNLSVNPNRYGNNHTFVAYRSQDVLFEDNESYVFHRHCVSAGQSERVVVRRQYCNPRGGRIAGGVAGQLGAADAVFSMYPCKNCILENSIADGTTHGLFLNEMNATYDNSVLMSGSKVLGSICYKCNHLNGVFPNGRKVADLNHSPQNITIKDVAIVDWSSPSSGIKCQDCVGAVLDHITILGGGTGVNGHGIQAIDSSYGGTPAQNSVTMTNIIVQGLSSTSGTPSGFSITGHNTWSGDRVISYNNEVAFSPALPSNWTNAVTTNPGLGTCKLWVPAGAAAKGAGTGGSDIGATILYRYVNGTLTTTPLWDPITGEFPHGAADPDGINRQPGTSIDSIHTRLNVNAGGCSLPAGYGGGGGGGGTPSTVVIGTTSQSGTTGAASLLWPHTITTVPDVLLVCIALRDTAGNVGSVSAVTLDAQSLSLVKRQTTSPPHRAVELWKVASPSSGVRTLNVTTTGAVTGLLGRATDFRETSGLNTAVGNTAMSATPNVTAPTNTQELVIDCAASSNETSYTAGVNQTALPTISHANQTLLLASSTQSGSDGGVMDGVLGAAKYWAHLAVSLLPAVEAPPPTALLTMTNYQVFKAFGTESGVAAQGLLNTPTEIIPDGIFRLRLEATASVATTSPFGIAWFCQQNGGGYTKVLNTAGAHGLRFFGVGLEADMPGSLSSTTKRFSTVAPFVAGTIMRDDTSVFTVPALPAGTVTELEMIGVNEAPVDKTIQCQVTKDDGTIILVPGVTPTILTVSPRSSAGF